MMLRQWWAPLCALALLAAQMSLGAAASVSRQATPPLPPNVVVIMADDLDARLIEEHLDLFPHIAAIGRDGATFSQFVVTTPLCCPSRASILRGQYAHNHGVLVNGGEQGGFHTFFELGREDSTLATWLHNAGYRTGLFGKYLNGYPEGAAPEYVPPGWDDWHAFADVTTDGEPAFYQDYQMVENGRLVSYGDDPASYSTDVVAERAVTFIQDAAAGPFFAYVVPYAPHEPAPPAARHAELLGDVDLGEVPSFGEADVRDKPAYVQEAPAADAAFLEELAAHQRDRLRSMLAVDEMVGAIDSALGEAHVLDRTYVIFTSDNGSVLGEHGLWFGKEVPYEESIRVPTMMRGPGIAPGQTIDALALNIDLAPTIAHLAAAQVADFVDGRSLAPLLLGEPPDRWRSAALIENFHARPERNRRNRQQEPTLRGSPRVPPYRALRTDSLLYVEYENGERELYDLTNDPYQLENLAATAPRPAIEELSAHLATLETCEAAACREAEDAPLDLVLAATPAAAAMATPGS